MRFAYPKMHFLIRFAAMTAILVLAVYIFLHSSASATETPGHASVYSAKIVGAAIIGLVAISAMTLAPLFTSHEMDDIGIHLRNGIEFSISIRFDEIEAVETLETGSWTFGLLPGFRSGRVVLANGSRNLVSIKLKQRKRFRSFLGRSFGEIVVDLMDPDGFVKAANDGILRSR